MVKKKRGDDALSTLGQLGAYSQHAVHDVKETTKKARAARDEHFVDLVDPQRLLGEEERARRVRAARKAYFIRLGLLSGEKRRNQQADGESESAPDDLDNS